ncbi:MAG: FCD domain-containing protein [Pseudomonadota bacterium]
MPRRKPLSGSAAALAALRREAAKGGEGPDGRLPAVAALAARDGLDRRSVRRALEVLEAEGSVWRGAGDALFLAPAARLEDDAPWVGDELQEARLMLEPRLAALAAERAGPADVARLRGLAARVASAADADGLGLWDAALHRAIARAARNPWLLNAYMALDERRAVAVPPALASRRTPVEAAWSDAAAQEHRDVIDAVAARDPDAAEAAMRAHLVSSRERLAAALGLAPESAAQA